MGIMHRLQVACMPTTLRPATTIEAEDILPSIMVGFAGWLGGMRKIDGKSRPLFIPLGRLRRPLAGHACIRVVAKRNEELSKAPGKPRHDAGRLTRMYVRIDATCMYC